MSSTIGIVAFVASLVLAIVIHELGHLVTAKLAGMRADRFFVGFGPTLWSTRRGETEYGVKALLLGGYVRIMGMSEDDELLEPLVDALPEVRDAEDSRRWWSALDAEMARRGVEPKLARRIRDSARDLARVSEEVVPDGPTLRAALLRALDVELPASRRVGDVAHRLRRGDDGRLFVQRPAWQRTLVIVTGPASHLLIAFLLLFSVQAFWDQPTGRLTSVVGAVREGSPADDAGLEVGDELLAVDGLASDDFLVLRDALRQRPEQSVELSIARDGEQVTLLVVPEAVVDEESGRVGLIGIATRPELRSLGIVEAAVEAAVGEPGPGSTGGVAPLVQESVGGLVRILSPAGLTGLVNQALGREDRAVDGAVSLVGAASIAGQVGAREGGLPVVLALLAAINVFFFLFNLLPLPPFDGGHLAVIGIEGAVNTVRRVAGWRPDFRVRPEAIASVAIPVIAVLVLLLVTTLWLDVTDPIRL
jgi:membrane-associated protease RseP (regulator of RpoE activity)